MADNAEMGAAQVVGVADTPAPQEGAVVKLVWVLHTGRQLRGGVGQDEVTVFHSHAAFVTLQVELYLAVAWMCNLCGVADFQYFAYHLDALVPLLRHLAHPCQHPVFFTDAMPVVAFAPHGVAQQCNSPGQGFDYEDDQGYNDRYG